WTSWCLPCLEQHNFLEANYNAFKGKNVSIIGINVDSLDSENSKKYLKRRKLPWNNFSLFNSTDANKFPISIYPTYVLLSPNNSILLISNNIKNI
ncbi:TlpA disulfide reductase family protein, partial [Escherichia coli]